MITERAKCSDKRGNSSGWLTNILREILVFDGRRPLRDRTPSEWGA